MATFRESLKRTIEAARPDLTYCVPGAVRTGSLPSFYTRFGGYGERFTAQWELIVLVQVYEKKGRLRHRGQARRRRVRGARRLRRCPAHGARGLPRVPARASAAKTDTSASWWCVSRLDMAVGRSA